jgi:hypothetical protein
MKKTALLRDAEKKAVAITASIGICRESYRAKIEA